MAEIDSTGAAAPQLRSAGERRRAPRVRTPLATIATCVAVLVSGSAAVVYSGAYNVAATDAHWSATHWVFETARMRSIKARAAGIVPPSDLDNEARIVAGTSHFAEHCAMCHSAPGVEAQDLAEGMYPKPPTLTEAARRYTPGELFWILKNGIKMTGMPSWRDHGDDDLWNTVAFMQKLPGMTAQDYGKLVMASMAAGGHRMHGAAMDHRGMDMGGHMHHGAQPSPKER
jgi:mono/diheme cytochrome c family protein